MFFWVLFFLHFEIMTPFRKWIAMFVYVFLTEANLKIPFEASDGIKLFHFYKGTLFIFFFKQQKCRLNFDQFLFSLKAALVDHWLTLYFICYKPFLKLFINA